jgi:type IV pilus assembly protein PilQ
MSMNMAKSPKRTLLPHPAKAVLMVLAVVAGALLAAPASAENVLENISHTTLPGGKVELTLSFSNPVAAPRVFTTEKPPRIAFDLPDTRNGFAQRRIDIGAGATSAVSAVEAAGRTRVVVDLFRPAGYDTRISGNSLIVVINNGMLGTGARANAIASTDPTKAVAIQRVAVESIDFRRGEGGGGRVVVNFTGPGTPVDLKQLGDHIVLDLMNVSLPARLSQRLDVLDFATPVQYIETRAQGNGVRMEISARPPYEQLAYQTGSQYVLEVNPKQVEEKRGRNAEPEYSGSRVTFNFQDIPTRSVLQLIADVSDLNIVVADTVQGNVTLRLINVPWDQALDIVLRARGLDKRKNGNVIWVAPQAEIAAREQALADARIKQEIQEELVSDYIPISYGSAADIAALLTKDTQTNATAGGQGTATQAQRGFLSPRGSVTFDDRTNTLLVSDIPSKIAEIRQLVSILDRPVQQVLIESRIVIATDSFARELGVKFGVSGGYEDHNGNIITTSGSARANDTMQNIALNNRFNGGRGLPVVQPGQIPTTPGTPGSTTGGIAVPALGDRLNVNLPAAASAGSFGLAILGADYLLDLELSAAQTEGRGEVISTPRVITASQKEASIKQGQEIGYVTFQTGGGGVGQPTVNFKDAVLELKVTPTITADDRVYLNLSVKKDAVAGYTTPPGGGQIPNIDTREVNTAVLVDNGQTVVLGGIYEISKQDTQTKVPLLGDLPVLGHLFKNTGRNDTKAELLIFVTPRILKERDS